MITFVLVVRWSVTAWEVLAASAIVAGPTAEVSGDRLGRDARAQFVQGTVRVV